MSACESSNQKRNFLKQWLVDLSVDRLLAFDMPLLHLLILVIVTGCSTINPDVSDLSAPTKTSSPTSPILLARSELEVNENLAKNVILFIGDGMGVSTVTAARIFEGQSLGKLGESHVLSFESFPHVALVKTYNTNQQVSDSAGTATALLTGHKTKAGMIGVGPQSNRRSCSGSLQWALPTIGEIAENNGKVTGIVSTTRVTHATPAAVYAHSAERDWESDRFIGDETRVLGCKDIAYQLVNFPFGDGIDVVLGGGRREFFGRDSNGQRRDKDADLITPWLRESDRRVYITTMDELESVKTDNQVLGLFANDHLNFVARRGSDSTQPTLSQMTAKAIDVLSSSENGFFLMVEGGRIDHGHHEGRAGYALLETQEFARAITVALEKVDLAETLILVTADHSHTLTIAGYPTRGNPILGHVVLNDETGSAKAHAAKARDSIPFTTLGYINGPGAVNGRVRPVPATGIDAIQQSLYPTNWPKIDGSTSKAESHGGEDVAVYGIGPWAHLVGGVIEQNLIFHIITHAFGWTEQQLLSKEQVENN